eukprot:55174_1
MSDEEPQEQEDEPQEVEAQEEPEPEPEPEQKEPETEPEPEPQQQNNDKADVPGDIDTACNELYSDNPSFNMFTTKLAEPVKLKTPHLLRDQVGTRGMDEI